MKNKITINGIDCIISSSAHQQTGNIFFMKDPKNNEGLIAENFTVDEAQKISHYLRTLNFSVSVSSPTYYRTYGKQLVTMISIFMGQDEINEAFINFFKSKIKTF